MRSVGFVACLVVMLVVACASARACTVVGPSQPSPATFWLKNSPSVIVSGSMTRRVFPADRVLLEMVLLRVPPKAFFVPICGELPLVTQPDRADEGTLQAVTVADLAHTRGLLVAAGIPSGEITTKLVRAPQELGASATDLAVGQVLVDVRPLTDGSLDALARRIRTVAESEYGFRRDPTLWLRMADLVVIRNTCDSLTSTQYDADSDAIHAARLFGDRIGLRVLGEASSERVAPRPGDRGYLRGPQYLCGTASPELPFWRERDSYSASLVEGSGRVVVPNWTATVLERGVYRASGTPISRAPIVPGGLASTVALDRFHDVPQLVARSVQFPSFIPFVSARGVFRAVVRPDAMLVVLYADNAAKAGAAVATLRAAGIPSADLMVSPPDDRLSRNLSIDVRVSPVTPDRLAAIMLIAKSATAWEPMIVPAIADCPSVLRAVEQGALHNAFVRAQTMTRAAATSVAGLIGVAETGSENGAACVTSSHASVAELARAASLALRENWYGYQETSVEANGLDAQFTSLLVAAWRMAGAIQTYEAVDFKAVEADPLSLEDMAFSPYLPGVLANASRPLSTMQPSVRCETEPLAALADAVRAGHAKIKGEPVRALIDYRQELDDPNELCLARSSSAPQVERQGPRTPTVSEQVLVVP